MYRIRDLKNGKFQIHSFDGKAFEGNLKAILKKCDDFRLTYSEVEDALVDLRIKNHDIAEFGINGTYMFTYKDEKVA